MEKFEVSKEFILEAHNVACGRWKAKLEKRFPEAFKPKYKDGQWVICRNLCGEYIVRLTNVERICGQYCHLDEAFDDRRVYNHDEGCFNSIVRLATPEEIKSHLIALAEKKGFVTGARFNGSAGARKGEAIRINEEHKMTFTTCPDNHNMGLYCGDSWIFHNEHGWGKVIPSVKEVTLKEIADKFGISVSEIKIV